MFIFLQQAIPDISQYHKKMCCSLDIGTTRSSVVIYVPATKAMYIVPVLHSQQNRTLYIPSEFCHTGNEFKTGMIFNPFV